MVLRGRVEETVGQNETTQKGNGDHVAVEELDMQQTGNRNLYPTMRLGSAHYWRHASSVRLPE